MYKKTGELIINVKKYYFDINTLCDVAEGRFQHNSEELHKNVYLENGDIDFCYILNWCDKIDEWEVNE